MLHHVLGLDLQSLDLVLDQDPEYLIVCGADHVYRMDFAQLVADHIDSGAEVTVAGIRGPRAVAGAAVIDVDDTGRRITRFLNIPAAGSRTWRWSRWVLVWSRSVR